MNDNEAIKTIRINYPNYLLVSYFKYLSSYYFFLLPSNKYRAFEASYFCVKLNNNHLEIINIHSKEYDNEEFIKAASRKEYIDVPKEVIENEIRIREEPIE